jgi:pimeloyl-ACP methyl ester carboxylesterase
MTATEQLRLPVGDLVFDAVATGPAGGRLVLLLHGFPQTSWSWRGVWPALVEAGCRVVAPDQRGYSPGARPDGVEAYRAPHLVADAVGVLDALGAEQADVVGHDWGAAVAWQLAGREPQRVRTLTAVSVPHPVAFVEALTTDADQRRRSLYMRDFGRPGYEHELLADNATGLRSLFGGVSEVDVEHVLARLGSPEVLRRCLDWYAAQTREDATGLGAVTAPTLHVWSDGDVALGRAAAEGTRRHVQGPYRFEVLAGVSHWVPEQAAERLAALVLQHLTAAPCPAAEGS